MKEEDFNKDVLVIGAGLTGIEASLLLSQSGRKVHLIEKTSITGGNAIKFEEVYSNMECSTCMVAPKQQDLLQDNNINLLTLSELKEITGDEGNYNIKILKKPRYVDLQNCIGCNACFDPCPISVKNEFEENLSDRKAIFVPCAGALPNVPMIDVKNCLRFNGKDCQACKEACMFEAIDYNQKEELINLKVGNIIVATGYEIFNPKSISKYGYGKIDNIFTGFEFERLYSSNGPTEGNIILKNNETPKSAAIIHCVGRDEVGYCSSVCCMYSLKFDHYLKSKIPDIEIYEFYSDLCIPGKSHQKFYEQIREKGTKLIRFNDITISKNGKQININYKNQNSKNISVDMVILATSILPREDASNLAKSLGISEDKYGFFKELDTDILSISSSKNGIYITGCSQGPKNIQESISQADAAVGKILMKEYK